MLAGLMSSRVGATPVLQHCVGFLCPENSEDGTECVLSTAQSSLPHSIDLEKLIEVCNDHQALLFAS